MKTLAEVITFFGLDDYTDADGVVHTPSSAYSFYGVPLTEVTGLPIEYASNSVTADCYASTDETSLYIATTGTSTAGSLITQ